MMNTKSCKAKKIILSGYFGFDNFGDEAILGVLSSKLKNLGYEITAFSTNPQKTSELYGIKTAKTFCIKDIIKELSSSDILISGGGSLLQNVTSSKSLIYYLLIIFIAQFFRKKVIIFAQGIGPINGKFFQLITKNILKRCNLVTVRDNRSFELMKKWNVDSTLLCDPLFSLQLASSEPSNKVGIQLRSFKTLSSKLLNNLAKAIAVNFSDKEIEIFSFQDSLDLKVCQDFEKMLKDADSKIKTKIYYNQTSSSILERLKELDFMIGMRFHACLIALKYGIRTLAINYDTKVEKLAQDANIPYLSMNGEDDYQEKINRLKELKIDDINRFSNSKIFNWSEIEKELAR